MRMVTIVVLVAATAMAADSATERHDRRETDVVRAVRSTTAAVVNINTTQIIDRLPSWLDEDIFNFFRGPFSRREQVHSLGSGFVIHPLGYIVTNAHVVQQARQPSDISVSFADKTTLKATAAYFDREHDLAIVKVRSRKPLSTLKLGGGDDLMIGETVIAIGNPLGYQHTITVGVISAVDRTLEFRRGQVYRRLIQTDASINPGSSGGPLLNINGELIGINTAIRGDAQNIGFAINVEPLKRLLPSLLDAEILRRIDLGFVVTPASDGRQLRIASVDADSPADRSQLIAGDLIVAFEGQRLIDPIEFYVALLERPAGKPLTLTLDRAGKQITITMPFNVKPKPDGKMLAQKRLGLIVEELSAQQARQAQLSDRPVVIVQSIVRNSPAQEIGIRRRDIIDRLDRRKVDSLDKLGLILEAIRRGDKIAVGIVRVTRGMLYQRESYIEVR